MNKQDKIKLVLECLVERVNLEETESYEVYHNTFSSAVQTARAAAEAKGYEINGDDWFREVNTGPGKPSPGATTKASVGLIDLKTGKPSRKYLHIQVYNTGDKYELNYYIN